MVTPEEKDNDKERFLIIPWNTSYILIYNSFLNNNSLTCFSFLYTVNHSNYASDFLHFWRSHGEGGIDDERGYRFKRRKDNISAEYIIMMTKSVF